MNRYDVIVVGAGPGGSTTALYAARAGLGVLLVDKEVFPRDKACGDLLPGVCLQILGDLGLSREIESLGGRRIGRVVFANETDRLVLNGRDFASIKRKAFDQLLFSTAETCVDTLEGRVERLLISEGRVTGIRVKCADGSYREKTARVVVGADGYSSIVARTVRGPLEPDRLAVATRGYFRGIPVPEDTACFYYLHGCSPGYVWIFPVGGGLANVGLYVFANDYKGRGKALRSSFEAHLHEQPLSDWFRGAELVEPLLSWSLPLAGEGDPLHGDGVVLVGDAAGLVDPFWGHGIDSAMVSGRLAAETIARALAQGDSSADALGGYSDAVHAHFAATWRARRGLGAQIRALNALLGATPLDHFRRWLGESEASVE